MLNCQRVAPPTSGVRGIHDAAGLWSWKYCTFFFCNFFSGSWLFVAGTNQDRLCDSIVEEILYRLALARDTTTQLLPQLYGVKVWDFGMEVLEKDGSGDEV